MRIRFVLSILIVVAATAFAAGVARSFSPALFLPAVHNGSAPDQPDPTGTPSSQPPPTEPHATEFPTLAPPTEDPTPAPATPDPHATATPPHPSPTPGEHVPPIVVVAGAVDPVVWTMDPVTVQHVAIAGDVLTLTLRYGGGCRVHDFYLVAGKAFMESNPVQSDVLLAHDAHGDMCRALVTQERAFDLAPLKRTFEHSYPGAAGPIILRLRGWPDPIRYDF